LSVVITITVESKPGPSKANGPGASFTGVTVIQTVAVAGNICESGDVLTHGPEGLEDRALSRPEVGHLLAIRDAGAYGMAQGAKIDIDPNAWRIVDGELYLNVNKRVQRIWTKDISGYIALASQHWRKLMG